MTIAHGLMLAIAGLWAGAQNALAGGGSFITIPALMAVGLDARAANVTSSVALYPGQVATGYAGRRNIQDTDRLSFRAMCIIGALGGLVGAALLLLTPGATFQRLLPWLVLFATLLFAWSAFRGNRPGTAKAQASRLTGVLMQAGISIYGGYFGGGLGFITMASLALLGLSPRPAAAVKNALAAVINTTSLAVFVFSRSLAWLPAVILACGALVGGLLGASMVKRIPERILRMVVVIIGAALTVGLFLTQ